MNKLLITVFICFGVSSAVTYAQVRTTVVTDNKTILLHDSAIDNVDPAEDLPEEDIDAEEIEIVTTAPEETSHTSPSLLHILVKNNDFYRVDKGQRGIFFIIQDFYTTGEKRTDPFLITNIEKAKQNNFDVFNYDNLGVNGLLIVWFKNSQVEQKGIYEQGNRKGLWVAWYENGQKRASGQYKEGLKEGQWTFWYQNGRRMQKGYYQADKKQGVWIFWYGNGRKKEAGRYRDDQKVERWSYWNNSGKLVKDIVKETNE